MMQSNFDGIASGMILETDWRCFLFRIKICLAWTFVFCDNIIFKDLLYQNFIFMQFFFNVFDGNC